MLIIGVEERQLLFGKKILWTWDDQVKQFSASNGPLEQPGSTLKDDQNGQPPSMCFHGFWKTDMTQL